MTMELVQHTVGDDAAHQHDVIDNSLPPILAIEPGETVLFRCPAPPIPENARVDDLDRIDLSHPHTIVGPVRVEGAAPGDALEIEIVDIALGQPYGHCVVLSGFGLLAERFPDPYVQELRFEADGTAELRPGVRIPLRPFCGIMGNAPAESGAMSTVPPRAVGGNVDIARLTAGTTVWLPVEVEGALFSCGDGHAAQGRGEVCGTALETALDATLRIGLVKDAGLPHPAYRTAPGGQRAEPAGAYVVTATGADLYRCSQEAIGRMVDHLHRDRGLTELEAYVLCSLVVDLAIEEIVDAPSWLVSASLPLDVFDG
ncbi:MAG TPA: acetamidase/formamidase family protein [Solirubrobacteraceae bacterium]|nr:acetamidase/formamidase family protein [Solirubrobacteraceae bacterium]